MSNRGQSIQPRDGVNPREGIREYGDVPFAGPITNNYPVDTEKHIHAAWSPICHQRDAVFHSPQVVACIERHIRDAAVAQGLPPGT